MWPTDATLQLGAHGLTGRGRKPVVAGTSFSLEEQRTGGEGQGKEPNRESSEGSNSVLSQQMPDNAQGSALCISTVGQSGDILDK